MEELPRRSTHQLGEKQLQLTIITVNGIKECVAKLRSVKNKEKRVFLPRARHDLAITYKYNKYNINV